MNKNSLIIVSGLPGVGKTTLAKKMANELGFVFVSMDGIKETMWNTMGHNFDFEFNDKIGKTAFELVFHFMELSLPKNVSLVIEAHFNPERNNKRFNELKEKFDINLLQIYCDCDAEVLKERFKRRMEKESYHDGHKHTISLYGEERILNSLGVKNKRLDIDGLTYNLDTTDFEKVDYNKLIKFVADNSK